MKRRAPRREEEEREGLLASRNHSSSTESDRLLALEDLRATCAITFDANEASHQECLQQIWEHSFPLDVFALPSPMWKQLGFQGNDPTTDLRGAGLIGLRHFAAFLNLMPEGEGLAVDPSEADDPLVAFPWSIASINCTAMLLTYLQLAPKLTCAFLPGGRCECSDDTLHGFLGLSFSESDDSGSAEGAAALVQTQSLRCLQAMHARLLIYLKDLWKQMRRAEPKTNLMDFPAALQATHSHMRRVLSTGGAAWLSLEGVSAALGQYDLSDLSSILSRNANGGWVAAKEGALQGSGLLEVCVSGIATVAVEGVVKPAGWVLFGVASLSYNAIVFVSCGICGGSDDGTAASRGDKSRLKAS